MFSVVAAVCGRMKRVALSVLAGCAITLSAQAAAASPGCDAINARWGGGVSFSGGAQDNYYTRLTAGERIFYRLTSSGSTNTGPFDFGAELHIYSDTALISEDKASSGDELNLDGSHTVVTDGNYGVNIYSGHFGATIAGTVACAPLPPQISISDATANEGDSGDTTVPITISLSAPAPAGGVSFGLSTADGTATVADADYHSATFAGFTIPAGATSIQLTATVVGDTKPEPDEHFFVNLYAVSGATIADGQAVITILNDDAALPVVTALSRSAGPMSAGAMVVITGTNLGAATAVYFGGTPALSFTVNSDTQITATSPSGSGLVDVRVITDAGASDTSGPADDFFFAPRPVVSSLSPATGPTAGGTTVVLTGTGFDRATQVTFGGLMSSFTVDSDMQITAVSPARMAGATDVQVLTPGGGSNGSGAGDDFTYADIVFTQQPADANAALGQEVTFTVAADNAVSYVWERSTDSGATWGTIHSSTVPTLSFNASAAQHGWWFRAVASAPGYADTASEPATLHITATPAIPVIASPVNGWTFNVAAPIFSGTATAGVTVNIALTGASVVTATVVADGSGAWTYTPATLADGAYTLAVSASNAGGTSAETSNSFTIDTVAPPMPTISYPLLDDGVRTPSSLNYYPVSGTAEPGSRVDLNLDGMLAQTVTANGAGAWQAYFWTTAEGDYALTVTAKDAAGNISPSLEETLRIDRTPPAAPVLSSPSDGAVVSTVRFIGTTERFAQVIVRRVGGANSGSYGANAAGVFDLTLTHIMTPPEGEHTFEIVVWDRAGNESPPATITLTVDTTAPAAPTITAPLDGERIDDGVPIVSGTAEAKATITVLIDGSSIGTATADGGGAWSFTPPGALASGSHAITATATDEAGNVSPSSAPVSFTVGAATPVAPVITAPADGALLNNASPTISGTAEASATVSVTINGIDAGSVAADGAGTWSFTPAGLSNGVHTVLAQTTTAGGTSAPSMPISFTIDTVPPITPTISNYLWEDGYVVPFSTNRSVWGTTAEPGSRIQMRLDGAPLPDVPVDSSGAWAVWVGSTAEGRYEMTLTATDAAGNISLPSAPVGLDIDHTAPAAPVLTSPADGSVVSTVTIAGQTEPFGQFTIAGVVSSRAGASGLFSIDLERSLRPADGVHTFEVFVWDRAVNESPRTSVTVTVDSTAPAAPVITSPLDGTTTDNATPTITGTAEAKATITVLVGGSPVGTTTADSGGGWSFTPSTDLANGSHAIAATATDEAGNVSPASAAVSLEVDLAPPVVISATPNPLPAANATVTFVFEFDAPVLNAAAEDFRLVTTGTVTGVIEQVLIGGSNVYVVVSELLGGGQVQVELLAESGITDLAGNGGGVNGHVSSTLSTAHTVARTPPEPPVVLSPVEGERISGMVSFSGTAEPNAKVIISFNGSPWLTDYADATGSWSATLLLIDSTFTVTVVAENPSTTLKSEASAPVTFTVDGTAPAAPVISAPVDGSTVDDLPTITGEAEANATVTILLDGASAGTVTAAAWGGWSFTPVTALADGPYTVSATAADAAGNVSAASAIVSFTVDVTAPDAPAIITPVDGSILGDGLPAITGTAEANATVTILIDGAAVGSVTASASGSWSFTLVAALADGVHTVSATATDAAGNVSAASSLVTFVVSSLVLEDGVLAPGRAGAAYVAQIAATGGIAPHAYTLAGGALPPGVDLSAAGVLSGAPTASGDFAFTVQVEDGTGRRVTTAYRLTILASMIEIAPTDLPQAAFGQAYEQTLTASGGVAPYADWRIVEGSLPAGLTLSHQGGVSGAPETFGSFDFTVAVRDSSTGDGPYEATRAFTLMVAAPPPPEVTTPQPADVPSAGGSVGTVSVDLGELVQGVVDGFRIVTQPRNGQASIGNGEVTAMSASSSPARYVLVYTPDAAFMGADQVSVVAFGPGGNSAPATFTFHVAGQAPNLQAEVVSDASITLEPTQTLAGGPFTALRIVTPPAYGAAQVEGLSIVFTPGAANGGATFLEYVVEHPFGVSASGRIDLVSHLAVESQALTAQSLAGLPVTVRITDEVRGGPFTDAAVVSVSPSEAGQAVVRAAGAGQYDLTYTPQGAFDGEVVITYTLSNTHSTATSTLTVTVEARPDPSLDPNVRGLATSQVTSARRFADAQISNFQRRLEALRSGENPSSNGVTLNVGFGRNDAERDPRAALARELRAQELDPGARDDLSRDFLGLDVWAGRQAAQTNADAVPDRTGQRNLNAAQGDPTGGGSAVGVWTAGSIDWGRQDASGTRDHRFRTQGLTVGVDAALGDRLILGGGVGYGHDRSEIGSEGSLSTARSITAALYGSWRITDAVFVDGVMGRGELSFDSRRWTTGLAGEPDVFALGEREGEVRFVSATLGRMADHSGLRRSIYVRIDARDIVLDPFTETGAGLASLSWDTVNQDSLSATLGASWAWRLALRERGQLSPYLRLEWSHELQDIGVQGVRYADWASSPTYLVAMDAWSRDSLNLNLGAEWSLTRRLAFGLGYRGNLGSASSSHGGEMSLKWEW